MYRTPKRAYVLVAVLGALAAAVIVPVRDVWLGYSTSLAGAGPSAGAQALLAVVLPELLAAFLLLALVFSRSNILARTYDGVVFGGIYALFFSAVLAVAAYVFGFGAQASVPDFACEVAVRLACGLLLGAAVGQARYCNYRLEKGTGWKFIIAGLLVWFVFQGVYVTLEANSTGGGMSVQLASYLCAVVVVTFLAVRAAVKHRKFDWEIRRV